MLTQTEVGAVRRSMRRSWQPSATRLLALALVVVCLALTTRASADQIMWMMTVTNVTVQDLDKDGKPVGKPRPAPMAVTGSSGCAFKVAPKGVYHPWEDGQIDDTGKFHRAHHAGGAPQEVSDCALGAFLNYAIKAPAGTYRVSGTVTFKKTLYHPGL